MPFTTADKQLRRCEWTRPRAAYSIELVSVPQRHWGKPWIASRDSGHSPAWSRRAEFPASKTISAALVDAEPGALRELDWHPNGDERQYYIEGQSRMTVSASESKARTFDYQAGDVGYVPRAMGHFVENIGKTRLRFLEVFRAPLFQDVSLTQWLALTPHQLVQSHLNIDHAIINGLPTVKHPVIG